MTNRDFYTAIISNETLPADLREHAEKEIAKLDKRNTVRSSKPSKTQLANEPIKELILAMLTEKPMTASELHEANPEYSVQKYSALCRDLRVEGKLNSAKVKIPKKGKQIQYAIKEEVGE